ncbi:MAG TPA: PhoPQ-activated pathogenicity [Candidatus Hydrogenedentes bacterium]|nr:PhoPQ-activated pathogenicity [Candidatus Hydrogenedentota bacterium]
MRIRARWTALCLGLLLFAAVPVFSAENSAAFARETANPTGLDRYVYAPDAHYAYALHRTDTYDGGKIYVLDLTSQAWRTESEVDRPVWKHWLMVVVPDQPAHETALLLISGGGNNRPAPNAPDPMVLHVARTTNCVAAALHQVPNQPLRFADEERNRSEDATIAYTWDRYMRTGDETWPLRMPMTKAAVRAMDAIQSFCAGEEGGGVTVRDFIVAGGSKRGWTTWTTAIVDNRVIAIVPAVIDLLNLIPSFRHHYAMYGEWAPAINDYAHMKIMDWMETPEFAALMRLVEPYSYRDRLTMPKLIMNGTQDEFFCPDSSLFYIDDLKGPTYLRYVPNVGHALLPSDAPLSLLTFFRAIVEGKALPTYAWSFPDGNTTRVTTPDTPVAVKLWQGTNPEARDFRTYKILGTAYTETLLEKEADGSYVGRVETPEKGWTAFFVELTFDAGDGFHHKFTTPVRFTPNTYPHEYVPTPDPPKGFLSR